MSVVSRALALALTVALVAPSAAAAASRAGDAQAAKVLVRKLSTEQFGTVLATRKLQALYYWTPEKRSPGKIFCTGACAVAWPPLYVKKGVKVPRKVKGYRGTFGVIVRPDGRRQLTYNRLPLYTYAHEGPRQVLCDDVDGWFVVRL